MNGGGPKREVKKKDAEEMHAEQSSLNLAYPHT